MKLNNILEQSKRGSAPADAYDGGSGNGGVNSSSETTNNGKRGTNTGGADNVGDNGKRNNPDEKRKPAPAPVTSNDFACLLNYSGIKIVKTSSPDQVRQTIDANNNWFFFKDKKFLSQDKNGTTTYSGTWKCDGDKDYIINTDDGDEYTSKTRNWKGVPNSGGNNNSGGSGSTIVDTTLTGDDLKNGKSVKKGMKGDIVGKIQQFLIDKGYKNVSKSGKVDNIFGKRTKASVEEFQTNNGLTVDGAVGKDTWPKLNDPKAVTKGNATSTQTSNNNTPGADLQGTGDTYVSGSDAKIMEKDIPDVLKESVKKILRKSLLKHIK